ncbi:ABC transporter permease [Arthrobacter globiformis]|uniref:ABC transporter permease n=1 Tax=Arthrobacter globiformis TaxID=1665 RepID=UPI001552ABCA|nr:ABC transporter permease [Arthrobacter globiformis]
MPATVGLVAVLLWQILAGTLKVPTYILPLPTEVANTLWTDRAELWNATLVTTFEVLAGFILAVLVSVPVAMLIVSFKWFETVVYPFLVLLQTVPKIALAPLFVVWFGFGIVPKVLVTFLICFFPILLDTMTGLRSSNPDMASMVRSMGGGKWSIFTKVRLPAALPHLFSGLKVAITLAVVGAVVGEFVGATQGLGYLLLRANANLDTPLLFAAIVILTVLGLIVYYAVSLIERLTIPWHVSHRSETAVTTGPAL